MARLLPSSTDTVFTAACSIRAAQLGSAGGCPAVASNNGVCKKANELSLWVAAANVLGAATSTLAGRTGREKALPDDIAAGGVGKSASVAGGALTARAGAVGGGCVETLMMAEEDWSGTGTSWPAAF